MRLLLFLLMSLPAFTNIAVNADSHKQQHVDFNHTTIGGYGYLISQDNRASVWWAEGAYKVLKDAPIPSQEQTFISLSAAKNEYESVMVVVNPKQEMPNFRIEVKDFFSEKRERISKTNVQVRKVEYVKINISTDRYGVKGYVPDPMPLYEAPLTLKAVENSPLWITIHVPADAKAGIYKSELVLTAANGWEQRIPISLKVRHFKLPETSTIRSGWGLDMKEVARYENLHTEEQIQAKFDKYMQLFAQYKLSPYYPFTFSPIHEKITGVPWKGGTFDSKEKMDGKYGYKVVDKSTTENQEATLRNVYPIHPGKTYEMHWYAKSKDAKQAYVVGIQCYDADKKLIKYQNRIERFSATPVWRDYMLKLGDFDEEIRYINVILCPSNRTLVGEDTGTMWFDNIAIKEKNTEQNIFEPGYFEVNLDKIDIQLDFSDFEIAAKKYFAPPYNFTGHRFRVKGLGSKKSVGNFEGFEQGTDEYKKLMKRYLMQIQDNLERIGILGKEYIYWIDEPEKNHYQYIYETNKMIKEYAPKLTTFLTEHIAGQDISEVTDISCTIWHKLNHEKIESMNKRGLQYWSYLCVWPKAPWISEFIDHDAINMRMWLWASYKYNLKGFLMWQTTYWNSMSASPKGYLQNPWEEPMSFTFMKNWPYGKQTRWGNGDGRFFYPENRNPNRDKTTVYDGYPIPSIRLEFLRDGIEDYEYFCLLEKLMKKATRKQKNLVKEAEELLKIPTTIYTNEKTYNKNPKVLLNYRQKIADLIERFIGK